jgi:hypothetical protein
MELFLGYLSSSPFPSPYLLTRMCAPSASLHIIMSSFKKVK